MTVVSTEKQDVAARSADLSRMLMDNPEVADMIRKLGNVCVWHPLPATW